jgi:hypothetical protein
MARAGCARSAVVESVVNDAFDRYLRRECESLAIGKCIVERGTTALRTHAEM